AAPDNAPHDCRRGSRYQELVSQSPECLDPEVSSISLVLCVGGILIWIRIYSCSNLAGALSAASLECIGHNAAVVRLLVLNCCEGGGHPIRVDDFKADHSVNNGFLNLRCLVTDRHETRGR